MDRGERMLHTWANELCSVDILQGLKHMFTRKRLEYISWLVLRLQIERRDSVAVSLEDACHPKFANVGAGGERGKGLNRVGIEEANVVKAWEQGVGWLVSASVV
jgi:hypothetical protein